MSTFGTRHEIDALPYPDSLYLRGAEGWLDLGNADEADRELNGVAPEQSAHPEVLALRWNIYVKAQRWDDCIAVASMLADRHPDDPCGWVTLAQSLYFQKRIAEAYEIGIAKVAEFPNFWPLLYDTACYACRLGKRSEAEWYLHLAMTVGDPKAIKLRALEDPDLKELWKARCDQSSEPGRV